MVFLLERGAMSYRNLCAAAFTVVVAISLVTPAPAAEANGTFDGAVVGPEGNPDPNLLRLRRWSGV